LLVGSLLLVVVVAGVWIRVDGLRSSLWLDEFGTLWTAEGSIRTTWDRATSFHGQTPLYYLLAWIPIHLFGESEAILRSSALFFGLGFWAVLYFGIRAISGPSAAFYSLLFAGFDLTLVSSSAFARPYSLALFCLALAILGFMRAVTAGDRTGRLLWILGGSATAWAHYLFFPVVMGLVVAYWAIPTLRRKYRTSAFILDLVPLGVLVGLTLPQLAGLFQRRTGLDWVSDPGHLVPAVLFFPLLVALVFGQLPGQGRDRTPKAVRLALWISLAFPYLLFEGMNLFGVNLLHIRYMQGILVPGIVLASTGLARRNPLGVALGLLWAGLFLGGGMWSRKAHVGTFSGLGLEDWRRPVALLVDEIGSETVVPVLFRSGFVEEDRPPLGSPPDATLAPLRSPGRDPPEWDIIHLTYRWEAPGRADYFDEVIRRRLDGAEEFFYLGRVGPYSSAVKAWVAQTWPGIFNHSERSFGSVGWIQFKRRPGE
jgi:hypothetical protein